MNKRLEHEGSIVQMLVKWEKQHPYGVAFIFSSIIIFSMLFWSPAADIQERDLVDTQNISIVNIDKVKAPKRVVRKQYSTDKNAVTSDASNVDRSRGLSDAKDALDLSMNVNIIPPNLIGSLPRIYPRFAKDLGVEAFVMVQLLISADGRVLSVKVRGVRFSKAFPMEIQNRLFVDFSRAARKMLLNRRFTPTIINGARRPVYVDKPLKFRLKTI